MGKKWIAVFGLLLATLCAVGFLTLKTTENLPVHSVETATNSGTRIDYYNSDGALTVNPDTGYASCIKALDSRGHTLLEEYRDSHGRPARVSAGYCGIRREYDELGQCTAITYLDGKGRPVNTAYGYAKMIRSFNDRGFIDIQRYYTAKGQPARDWAGAYGFRRSYDEAGRVSRLVYLGKTGQPESCRLGYSEVHYAYNEKWLRETKFYFDTQGNPAPSEIGVYGLGYLYDEGNRVASLTCLDTQGQPMNQAAGYAKEVNTYANDGTLLKTAYFTSDGSPALVQGRYHAVTFDHGRRYFDIQGKAVFLPEQYLKSHLKVVALAAVFFCLGALVLPERVCIGLSILYVFFIFYMTLMNRSAGSYQSMQPLLSSYRLFFASRTTRNQILGNIALFVPLGALLGRLSRKGRSWMVFVGLTAAVELVQLITGLGRFDADDIFSNILGGFVGWGLVRSAYAASRSGKER